MYWTNSDLEQFNRELDAANMPDWRRDLYIDTRRQNCPTFAEARASIRSHVKLCTTPLRVVRTTPGHLTEYGIKDMWKMICRLRVEHSQLIRQEKLT